MNPPEPIDRIEELARDSLVRGVLPYLAECVTPASAPSTSSVALRDEGDGAGADLDLTAERVPGGYVVRGRVRLVSNAAGAHTHYVVARLPGRAAPGDTVLLGIPAATPGVEVGAPLDEYRIVADDVRFDGAGVPISCRVGDEGMGATLHRSGVTRIRPLVACAATAAADRLLDVTNRHAATRRSFGATLHGHQAVRLQLAEWRTRVEACRRLAYAAVESGAPGLSAAAKLKAVRTLRHAAEQCMALHGAHGYLRGHEVAALAEEARVFAAATGDDESMSATIARERGLDGL